MWTGTVSASTEGVGFLVMKYDVAVTNVYYLAAIQKTITVYFKTENDKNKTYDKQQRINPR